MNTNNMGTNQLEKVKKKNFFQRFIDELKIIFASEKDESIANKNMFLNADEYNKNANINMNLNMKKDLNSNLNTISNENANINTSISEENKILNIDLTQNANEAEIIKKRANHLFTDSINSALELDDLSYYDLKILYNELLNKKS